MATFTIRRSVPLDLAPERVFPLLVDPERVVVCLPGASLEGRDGDTVRGSMVVRLGAVRVAYQGTATFEEVDSAARRIRLAGSGRERTGSGSARMTMTGTVEAAEGGGCLLVVDAELDLSGRMVRFGRGMIERVAGELIEDFTACLSGLALVEERDAGEAPDAGGAAGGVPAAPGGAAGGGRPRRALPRLLRALRGWVGDLLGRLTGRPGR